VVYAGLPALARFIGLETLGTFHERHDEQALLTGSGGFAGAWGRAFGSRTDYHRGGPLAPEIDGHLFGFQAGFDIAAVRFGAGHSERVGMFVGHAEADGDVRGFAIGQRRAASGVVPLGAASLGIYWTHLSPSGWHLDGVLMHSWLDGDPRSHRGIGIEADGRVTTASLEGGHPIWLTDRLSLEPQAQVVWQRASFSTARDLVSSVSFDSDDAFTGRIGTRAPYSSAAESGSPWDPC
jgi:outer membrane autotransporter protein